MRCWRSVGVPQDEPASLGGLLVQGRELEAPETGACMSHADAARRKSEGLDRCAARSLSDASSGSWPVWARMRESPALQAEEASAAAAAA